LLEVIVLPNESIDGALKRFDNKLQQSGVLRRLKEKSYYEKPSDKRRRMKRRSGRRPLR
jgi:small subunit ribosomal protein S21